MSEKKMKRSVKKKWLKALRSGKYQQAKSALCEVDGGYCCLGVLSELAVEDGATDKWTWEEDDGIYTFGKKRGDHSSEFLPRSVQKWAGIDDFSPSVPSPDGGKFYLAELNDGGRTFEEIADLIELHL